MKKNWQITAVLPNIPFVDYVTSNSRRHAGLAFGCLMAPLLVVATIDPASADCSPTSGAVICSGTTTTTQTILVDQPTTITTAAGFSLDSAPGTIGLVINGWGAGPISFDDQNASTITGGVDGINVNNPDNLAANTAVGALSITTTGHVTGTAGIGIFVYHAGRLAGDLTINAVDVTGANNGIYTTNSGAGSATHITTTGTIEATNGVGLNASNLSTAAGLFVETTTVTGTVGGLLISNQGHGETSVTAVTAISAQGTAFQVYNSDYATDLTANVGTAQGGSGGILVMNSGSGSTTLTATGTVSGGIGTGIVASNTVLPGGIGTPIDLTVNAVDVTGGDSGIRAYNVGTGNTSITTTGPVSGANGSGILAQTGYSGQALTIRTVDVTGSENGIEVQHTGSGLASITADGVVEGTGNYGISTTLSGSGYAKITLTANGKAQGAQAGVYLEATDTPRSAEIDNAGTIRNLSGASDALAVEAQGDVSTTINNSHLVTGTVVLTDGDDVFTNKSGGTWNTAGGTNDFGTGTNGVNNQAGASVVAAATGAGGPVTTRFNNVGTFSNAGTVAMQNGVVGDQTVIQGDYVGDGGKVTLDTTLGTDGSPSDLLVIDGGTATGSTKLDIQNVSGTGALTTGNGIMVVNALNGATTESTAFSLDHAVAVNAFDYALYYQDLARDDQNWYLRSTGKLNPSSQTALPYADVLSNYARATLGTLQQRTGNRIWPGVSARVAADLPPKQAMAYAPGGPVIYGQGAWGRIGGQYSSYDPTSGSSYTQSIGFLQAGYEGVAYENASGDLSVGGYATVGTSTAHIDTTRDPVTGATRARGKITATGYGLGMNAPWLGDDGFYADAIGQLTWYDSDLSNQHGGSNQGWSSVLSLEAGKRFDLGSGWSVVPQAQLAWTHVDFDSFTDINGSQIGLGKGDSLEGRVGMRVENLASWQDDNGAIRRLQLYGIANLNYEFLNGTSVKVEGTAITQQNKRLWGEVGLGGTYAWNDQWSLYGEADYAAALSSGSGDNYTVKGTAGLRYRW